MGAELLNYRVERKVSVHLKMDRAMNFYSLIVNIWYCNYKKITLCFKRELRFVKPQEFRTISVTAERSKYILVKLQWSENIFMTMRRTKVNCVHFQIIYYQTEKGNWNLNAKEWSIKFISSDSTSNELKWFQIVGNQWILPADLMDQRLRESMKTK